jgi:glycosyltransferase involved in cell wall biosynthesis
MIRLFVVQPFGERRGGSDHVLLTFLRHLDRGRFDPRVAFLEQGGFEREIAGIGVRTVAFPGGRMRRPAHLTATVIRLARVLRRDAPDLVVNWLSTGQIYGAPAALLAGVADRCVWWQHDLPTGREASNGGRSGRVASLRGRAIDRLATALPARAVGACSESVAAAQARIHPRRPTVAVLPGVDPPSELAAGELARLRSGLGIPDEAFVVGTVGRLVAWKGHHILLRAIAVLRQRGMPAFGLFVGGGGHRAESGYEPYLRQVRSELGLDGSAVFTGQVPAATDYVQLMDAFVDAAAPEPFGLAVVEAMALGVPAVAVAAAGPTEIIRHRESGLLVESSEPETLAAAVAELARDASLRSRLADAGRARYRERFTGERMTRDMEQVLAGFAR